MAKPTIKAYYYPYRFHIVLGDNGIRNINMSHGEADFKVYTGVVTRIDFDVKNTDRKPVDLTDKDLLFYIADRQTNETVLVKPMQILNAEKGKAQFEIIPTEAQQLTEKYYAYSIMFDDGTDAPQLLYTDQIQSASGWFEVKTAPGPTITKSIDMGNTDEWLEQMNNGIPSYHSSAFKGDGYVDDKYGLHTIAFYLDQYTGSIQVKGSLEENTPSNEANWFDIALNSNLFTLEFSEETGLCVYNFYGNIRWIKVIYTPHQLNYGNLTKVLLKI